MNPRTVWVLFKREMMAYFYSPTAYVIWVFFLLFMAFCFWVTLEHLNSRPGDMAVMDFFLTNFLTWFLQVLLMPVLTMRLFAEEYRLGTYEGLITAPVREREVVLGKFAAVVAFYMVLWLPTALYPAVFKLVSLSPVPAASGPVWCSYLVILMLGMFLASIGMLVSAMTRSQLVAATVSVAIACMLFFIGFINNIFALPNDLREMVQYMSIWDHSYRMSSGFIDTRIFAYYLSGTAFFLYATQKVLEGIRWKT